MIGPALAALSAEIALYRHALGRERRAVALNRRVTAHGRVQVTA